MNTPLTMAEAGEAVDFLKENIEKCKACGTPFDPKDKRCLVCIERWRLVREAKKHQAKMRAREKFSNHIKGLSALMKRR